MPATSNCLTCGKSFKPDKFHPYQKFCSVKCGIKYHNKKRNHKEFYQKCKKKRICVGCHSKIATIGVYCVECKKRHKERSLQRWKKLRMATLQHYGKKCQCCGEHRIEFLAIDHIKGENNHNKKQDGNLYEWLRRNNYPKGFRTLCHNCNQALGHYGYCPHKKYASTKS